MIEFHTGRRVGNGNVRSLSSPGRLDVNEIGMGNNMIKATFLNDSIF